MADRPAFTSMDWNAGEGGFSTGFCRRVIRFLVFLDVCPPALQQCFPHASQCIFEDASSNGHFVDSTGRIASEAQSIDLSRGVTLIP